MQPAAAQELLVKLKQGGIDLINVKNAVVNKIPDDDITCLRGGKGVAGLGQQALGFFPVKLQRDRQRQRRLLEGVRRGTGIFEKCLRSSWRL